jgi:hypothetical protein
VKPACPYITDAEYGKLTEFIAGRRGMERDTEHLMQLEQELERADLLGDNDAVPP